MKKSIVTRYMLPRLGCALSHGDCGCGCNGAGTCGQTLGSGQGAVGGGSGSGTGYQDIVVGGGSGNGTYPDGATCGRTQGRQVNISSARFNPSTMLGDYSAPVVGSLRFVAVAGAGITKLYIPDATGIAASLGQLDPAFAQPFEMDARGVTLDNLAQWLKTNALFICSYSLASTNQQDLGNFIDVNDYNINGTYVPQLIDNGLNQNPINPNSNLIQTNCGFMLKNNTGIFVNIQPDMASRVQLTLRVSKSVPYTGAAWSQYCLPICTEGC